MPSFRQVSARLDGEQGSVSTFHLGHNHVVNDYTKYTVTITRKADCPSLSTIQYKWTGKAIDLKNKDEGPPVNKKYQKLVFKVTCDTGYTITFLHWILSWLKLYSNKAEGDVIEVDVTVENDEHPGPPTITNDGIVGVEGP